MDTRRQSSTAHSCLGRAVLENHDIVLHAVHRRRSDHSGTRESHIHSPLGPVLLQRRQGPSAQGSLRELVRRPETCSLLILPPFSFFSVFSPSRRVQIYTASTTIVTLPQRHGRRLRKGSSSPRQPDKEASSSRHSQATTSR